MAQGSTEQGLPEQMGASMTSDLVGFIFREFGRISTMWRGFTFCLSEPACKTYITTTFPKQLWPEHHVVTTLYKSQVFTVVSVVARISRNHYIFNTTLGVIQRKIAKTCSRVVRELQQQTQVQRYERYPSETHKH